MKYKPSSLLSSFLILALITGFSLRAHAASEVTGSLSSSGNTNTEENTNQSGNRSGSNNEGGRSAESGGNAGNGALGGVISGGSGSSGNTGGEGNVLGAQTQPREENSGAGNFSSGGTALSTMDGGLALDNAEASTFSEEITGLSAQAGEAAEGAGLSGWNWFWITLLLLLIIGIITYAYSQKRGRQARA